MPKHIRKYRGAPRRRLLPGVQRLCGSVSVVEPNSTGDRLSFSVGIQELFSAAYLLSTGQSGMATYEVSVRALPPRRSFLIAAGLTQVLEFLEGFALDEAELDALRSAARGAFPDPVYDWLRQVRFTGDVDAMPEGTVFFAGEPVLRVRSAAPQAVLVGSAVLAALTYQTGVATKMSRLQHAARDRPVFETGAAVAPGRQSAHLAARAAYLGGGDGTSNAQAATRMLIPARSSIPLSVVEHDSAGSESRRRLAQLLAGTTVLLDSADVLEGLRQLVSWGTPPQSILIDCGDLVQASTRARKVLDEAGWKQTKIFVCGGLDAGSIEKLVESGAPVDGFGVGHQLVHSPDTSMLRMEYNLVEWERGGQVHAVGRSTPGHEVIPGAKAVYRRREHGLFRGDRVQPAGDTPPPGQVPLLVPVFRQGRRTGSPSLAEQRTLCLSQIQMLDPAVTRVANCAQYPVDLAFETVPAGAQEVGEELELPVAEDVVTPVPAEEEPQSHFQEVLEHLDDSADFGAMSSVLDRFMSRHRLWSASAGDGASGGAAEPDAAEPPAPVAAAAPTPPTARAPQPAGPPAPRPSPAARPPAPPPPREPAAPRTPPSPETFAPETFAPPPKPVEPVRRASREAPPSAGPAPAMDPATPSAKGDVDSLVAKLRTMKAPAPPPERPALEDARTAPAEPRAPAAAATQRPERAFVPDEVTVHSANPLAAAAKRLRALHSGGTEPSAPESRGTTPAAPGAAPADSPPAEFDEEKKVDPGRLLGAADRLRALRSQ